LPESFDLREFKECGKGRENVESVESKFLTHLVILFFQ